jgi:CheY-like chemotaxis protein
MRLTTIDHQARQPETRSCTDPRIQSRGTILVVDSDVRLISQIALEKDGYTVMTAANALDGLMLFAKYITAQFTYINSARVTAAIIDLRMPGMHGLELADLRQQINSLLEGAMTKTTGQVVMGSE